MFVAGKDIVGGDMNDAYSLTAQNGKRFRIDLHGGHFVFLRFVHIGVCGAVDDQIDGMFIDKSADSRLVGDVQHPDTV